MEQLGLIGNLGIALAAAFVGGLVAHKVRLPAIVGYLVAGIFVGPYTPGLVGNQHQVEELAEIGVILLMFALGSEFSLDDLKRVGAGAILCGILEIALIMAAGGGLGALLGVGVNVGIYIGALVALSSSVVILKVLLERGESDSVAGRLAVRVAILQDLSLVVLAVLLPNLAGPDKDVAAIALDSALGLGKAVLLLGATYILGTRLLPWALKGIALNTSREMFLLTVIAVAVITAIGAELVGISFAVGAFMGGLVITDSRLSHYVVEQVTPLRDLFIAIFFVSVGMLIDPAYIFTHLAEILGFLALIVLGKGLLFAVLFAIFRYPLDAGIKAAVLLAQIGEFSFVLASTGVALGLLNADLYGLILAGALLSIVLNPLLVAATGALMARLNQPTAAQPAATGAENEAPLHNHVIICGYGRVGSEMAAILRDNKVPLIIIENEQGRVQAAEREGIAAIYGDAANPKILVNANPESARLIAAVMSDAAANAQVVKLAHQLYPNLPLIARAISSEDIVELQRLGATAVVQPELEAAIGLVRHAVALLAPVAEGT